MTIPSLVVVVGPTGAGKTALAIALAERVGGSVVSCDSQQVYRGMDIGTGKATAEEQQRVPHYLLDVLDPDQEMTAAKFANLADEAIALASQRGPVVVCGGTGLYVRALLRGLFDGPAADPTVRARLELIAAERGVSALQQRLAAVDPVQATRIEPSDLRRIIRALEVFELTGEPMSVHQARHDHRTVPLRYPVRMVGLCPDRPVLHARIEARIDDMLSNGLLDEVQQLRANGYLPPLRSQQAIGYAELHRYLNSELTLPEAVELIKRNTRRYAKRQVTWYRGDLDVTWATSAKGVDLADLERYLTPRC